jgi:hypothetical protein
MFASLRRDESDIAARASAVVNREVFNAATADEIRAASIDTISAIGRLSAVAVAKN